MPLVLPGASASPGLPGANASPGQVNWTGMCRHVQCPVGMFNVQWECPVSISKLSGRLQFSAKSADLNEIQVHRNFQFPARHQESAASPQILTPLQFNFPQGGEVIIHRISTASTIFGGSVHKYWQFHKIQHPLAPGLAHHLGLTLLCLATKQCFDRWWPPLCDGSAH